MFHDQNDEIAQKVEARVILRNKASISRSRTTEATDTFKGHDRAAMPIAVKKHETLSSPTLSLLPNLNPTIDERAVSFFFSSHAFSLGGPSTGFIDHLQTSPQFELGDNLLSSIKAVGLVGISDVVKAPDLLLEAKKQYVSAVRCVNTALKTASDVTKDSTLLAVMVLGIYEILAGQSDTSLVAWAAHLKGAAALLKIRGPEQLKKPSGRRLYGQITAGLATSCMQQEVELPDHILELRDELDKYISPTDITWQHHRHLLLFTNLFARVQRQKFDSVQEILDESLKLDGEMTETFANVPEDWRYSIIDSPKDASFVYAGFYHIYRGALAAMVWNGMRTCRILLNEIIRNALLEGFSSKPPLFVSAVFTQQLQRSTDTLYQLASDVIASVPQHLEFTFSQTFHLDSAVDVVSSSIPMLKMAIYQLPWSLYCVGNSDVTTEPLLRWIIDTLRHMSENMGIRQASVLADRLERIQLPKITGAK